MNLQLTKFLPKIAFPPKSRWLALAKNPHCYLAIFLIIFLCGNAILNFDCISQTWKSFAKNKQLTTVPAKLESFPQTYHKTITDKFYFKDEFINLDGLAARLAQRKKLNGIYRTKYGLVAHFEGNPTNHKNLLGNAEKLIELSRELEKQKIPVIFCLSPKKPNGKGLSTPEFLGNTPKIRSEVFAQKIKSAENIHFVDMRPIAYNFDGYFLKTDHHWSPWSALLAEQEILRKIENLFPNAPIDPRSRELANFETKIYKKLYLGSKGRRVGKYFGGGLENFPLVLPKFETDITCVIPHRREVRTGNFFKAALDKNRLDRKKNYFHQDAYMAYLGGQYPQIICRNHLAKNRLRAMILGDSYMRPSVAFLSTALFETYCIDPRQYKGSDLARAVNEYLPNLVIFIENPGALNAPEFFTFGNAKNQLPAGTDILPADFSRERFVISANDKNIYAKKLVPAKFIANQSYELKIGKIKVNRGKPKGISMALQDQTDKKFVREWIVPAKCFNEGARWGFSVPANIKPENCELYIYAGIWKETAGNEIELENISLTTM